MATMKKKELLSEISDFMSLFHDLKKQVNEKPEQLLILARKDEEIEKKEEKIMLACSF